MDLELSLGSTHSENVIQFKYTSIFVKCQIGGIFMESIVKELSKKYCKKENLIRGMIQISLENNNSLEEAKEIILKFYSL